MLMIGKKLTEEQRLQKAVVDIMNNSQRYAALNGVLMIGKKEIQDGLPTAMTNGRDEFYGREFVSEISDAELRFVVLHETYHKLFRHLNLLRQLYQIDPKTANIACDHMINLRIKSENPDGFVVLPDWVCCDPQFEGMTEVQIFNKLRQDKNGGDGNGQGEGEGEEQSGQHGPGGDGTLDAHDWDGAKELTQDEKDALEREIDSAIRQGALVAGKAGSGGFRGLEDLLEAKVDWREQLRDFISETCAGKDFSTWRRPNRRYISDNFYMPSSVSETVDELAVAIDTSGSIGSEELRRFLSELRGVCEAVKPKRIRLMYWDTRVCRDEVYEEHDMDRLVNSTKPAGGGGTDITCVNKYMSEFGISPQAIVVLTDGYLGGSWGTWTKPVLWGILNNKGAKPTVGKTTHIQL